MTQENRQLIVISTLNVVKKEREVAGGCDVLLVIITDYCKVVRVQSQNQEKSKKQSSSNAVINIIHVPCYRSQKRKQILL